jgi:uncharacterized membrane protein YcaP (DUF421 family)
MSSLDGQMFFDGWAPIVRTLVLGLLAYVSLVVLLRVSGKRTLSKMNAFDFVVTVALGSTLASVLTSKSVSLVQGVMALALLILMQLVSTFLAVRSDWYQRLIKAQPTLIYFRGEFLEDAMRKQRITREEILAAMRQQGAAVPEDVDAVVLETEGSLSVLRQNASSPDSLEQLGVNVNQAKYSVTDSDERQR